jgi:tRNA-modifying protein YgfZ
MKGLVTLYTVIDCNGEDASTFLQGQLSCDINQCNDSKFQLAAHCNPQGRVTSLLYVIKHSLGFYLLTHKEMAQTAFDALNKYATFSKVTLSIKDCMLVGSINDQPNDDKAICQGSFYPSRQLAIFEKPPEQSTNIDALWHYHDIASGLPRLYPNTVDKFVAPRLNLEYLNAISYKKGCYIGQEIIARLYFKGKLKHHMYLGKSTDTIPLQAEDTLFNEEKKSIGSVVDCITHNNETYLLAITTIQTPWQAYTSQKDLVHAIDLPYTF